MNCNRLDFNGIFRPVLVIDLQVFNGIKRFKPINDSVNTYRSDESNYLP
jgi:hypothetical protein